ncbi:TRAP transporter small permease [Alkalihalobacillus oceani]|uniref:TRAP transporter small permease n=1 Tax=Halalkalibacter oceani TaxID=1653776 RepID=UPI00203FD29F|nr:TRAP transporter small permease [Halalkalibacter oceani]MCM3759166.1 TRAP transporter small permease [Halalkalibacter oceani]
MGFVRLVDRLNRFAVVSLSAAFIVMTLSIFLQVLVRFVFTAMNFQFSVPWTEELARYLMIWSVFIGGAVAVRTDKLIALEVLVHSLPDRLGKILKIGSHLLTMVFFGYLLYLGFEFALNQGERQTSPVMGIPMLAVYLSMPVGALLGALNLITLFTDVFLRKSDIRFVSMEDETFESLD